MLFYSYVQLSPCRSSRGLLGSQVLIGRWWRKMISKTGLACPATSRKAPTKRLSTIGDMSTHGICVCIYNYTHIFIWCYIHTIYIYIYIYIYVYVCSTYCASYLGTTRWNVTIGIVILNCSVRIDGIWGFPFSFCWINWLTPRLFFYDLGANHDHI